MIKSLLIKFNLYNYLYYSSFGAFINDLRNPSNRRHFAKELEFYRNVIGSKKKLIFDIGANLGIKTKVFLAISERVVSIEPNRDLVDVLHIKFGGNPRCIIIAAAISDEEEELDYFYSTNTHGFNTLNHKWKELLENNVDKGDSVAVKFEGSYKVKTTTLQRLIAKYGTPDYIKVDVEGFEWNVLKTLDTTIPCISFEANLPEFSHDSILIILHLIGINNRYVFNYSVREALELEDFVSAEEMIHLVRSGKSSYMEVFCKLS